LKKIITILGARPQLIKAASVSRAILNSGIREKIVHTGQHFDKNMSDIFIKEMGIPEPDYNLEINSLKHGAMTGRMIEKIEKVLLIENPNLVIVYGDTNSTLAGAIAAKKLHIKLAHIEAGLRSFNMQMPEEINRIITDRLSDYLFCPTVGAVKNLIAEGFENFNSKLYNVGDVMYDAALYYSRLSQDKSSIISGFNLYNKKFILCTIHREENTDNVENLKSIISALNNINKEVKIVLPLHPRTRNVLHKNNVKLAFDPVEPVGYFDIIELLKYCELVITDSGGMQKEAYFFRKYCITLREETEWTELVERKVNFLAGPEKRDILAAYRKIPETKKNFDDKLYGDGNSSERIVNLIIDNLK
jgi:UDP-GlcNAc3NAcA epimerase